MDQQKEITLREIYPQFSETELAEAEAAIRRYLAVLIRIITRLQAEGYTPADFDLTLSEAESMIQHERSKSSQLDN